MQPNDFNLVTQLQETLNQPSQPETQKPDSLKRPKKQMNFQSREEMLRYIQNFRVNYKTELCRNWVQKGFCEFDYECAYAHGHDELHSKKQNPYHKNYKTKMCRNWHVDTPGKCSYGDKCQFIHDERHSKPKGKICTQAYEQQNPSTLQKAAQNFVPN